MMKLTAFGPALLMASSSLLATASVKESRPILTCINFEVIDTPYPDSDCPKALRMWSTDSAIAGTDCIGLIEFEAEFIKPFNVPAKELCDALKRLIPAKAYPVAQQLTIEVDDSHVTITNTYGSSQKIQLNVQEYPNLQNCWPKIGNDGDFTCGVSVALLEKLVKAAKACKRESVKLIFPHALPVKGLQGEYIKARNCSDGIFMKPFVATMKSDACNLETIVTPLRIW